MSVHPWRSLTEGTSGQKWQDYNAWEYLSGGEVLSASQYLNFAPTSDPPTSGYIKIAQVLKNVDANNYQLTMYWDTGSGLVQSGSTVTVPASQVSSFGQYDTGCLVPGSSGNRYDAFGLMDFANEVPGSSGDIYFDEVRLYSYAMSPDDIAALTPNGE